MLCRKVTYKLYPNARQHQQLEDWTGLHCELYNAALQERIEAYRKHGLSIGYYDQQNMLPAIKQDRPDLAPLGSHALQQTLRKLDRAFTAFFRRVKAGQTPGFPRFKSRQRFAGFCYPDKAGWKLQGNGPSGATIRIGTGEHAMSIRARGRHRFGPEARPNDLTIMRKGEQWYASVTLKVAEAVCARERQGNLHRGIDFGVSHWATFEDGSTVDNPRFLRESLPELARLHRERARKRKGSIRYRRLSRCIARLHERIGNKRRDFIHKKTSDLVENCAVIATEALSTGNISRSARGTVERPGRRVKQKSGLNREILSVGLAMAHQMLEYKAAEAGTRWHVANTRQLKPTQRCSKCWAVAAKTLSQRVHKCQSCGHAAPRDQNSAAVVLIDAHTPGTGVTARLEPLAPSAKRRSKTRETPATTAQV